MALARLGSPLLYDEVTGDIVGYKDPDGSEVFFGAFTDKLKSDLSDISDPLKGAGMVGFSRSYPLKPATNVGYFLSTQPVNIWEKSFTDLIVDKPDPNDSQTWDWAPAIQAASNFVRTRFNTYGPGTQTVIDFPGGRYKVKSQVVISVFVKIRSLGMVVFETEVAGDAAFRFTPSAGDYNSNSTIIFKQQWFRGPFINGTAGGITFHNRLAKAGTTAIELGPRTDTGALSPFSRYSACHFNAENYAIGIKFNRFRNYIGTFESVHLELNTESVVFGDSSGANVVDAGENIQFISSIFANAETSFRWYCDGFDLNLVDCSVDYVGTVFRMSRLYKKVTWIGGHVEGIGKERAHDGIGGILLEESFSSEDAGTQCTVELKGVSGLTSPGVMFRGSSKVQLKLDYEYRKFGTSSDNTPETMFLVSPTINLRSKAIVMQQRATLPSWSVNHQRNPTFALDTEGSTTSPIGYTRVAGGSSSVIEAASASSLGGKAIKITGAASGNYYIMDSNDKMPCAPGDMVIANLFAKIPADVTAAQMSIACRLQFFSVADEVLLTTSEVSNDMGASELVPDQWTAHVWARQQVAPPGAAYYKARFGISGVGMNSRITYLTGLYSTILK